MQKIYKYSQIVNKYSIENKNKLSTNEFYKDRKFLKIDTSKSIVKKVYDSKDNDKLLKRVLAIDTNSEESVLDFLNEYGLFSRTKVLIARAAYNRTTDIYMEYDIIINTILRVKNLVNLISAYKRKNAVDTTFALTELIFMDTYTISFNDELNGYIIEGCDKLFNQLLNLEVGGIFIEDFLDLLNKFEKMTDTCRTFENDNEEICYELSQDEKANLIIVSETVIAYEINTNIKNCSNFVYCTGGNIELYSRIDSLISAIYMEICMINQNSTVLRKCANPTCNNYFETTAENTKKIYCCSNCATMVAKRKYRRRLKNKQNQTKKKE